jgi:hypothetical protein
MEGLVSLDEWARWAELLPEPDAKIQLAEDARNRLHGQTLRPVELDILARSKSGITIARVLDDSPHPDAAVAEAICTLLARGVVRQTWEADGSEAAARR